MDAGLLLARLVLGLLMADARRAEALRLVRRLRARRVRRQFFEALGFRPGRLFATAAAVSEVVSGVLLALGLFGPVGRGAHGLGDDRGRRQRALAARGVRDVERDRSAAALWRRRGRAGADRARCIFARRGARPDVAVDARMWWLCCWSSAWPAA